LKVNKKKIFISATLVYLFFIMVNVFSVNKNNKISNESYDNIINKNTSEELIVNKVPKPLSLGVADWDKDIFYDRSESYKKWFVLSGISKMRDGYKAFINNEILSEGDRIKGFSVITITETEVVLKKNNSSLTLKL
tara:strand:+ start:1031 stop:1438 length:408 start_codon:yes stop_codon:yes gene_type:complete